MPGQNTYTAEQLGRVIDSAEVANLDQVGLVQRLATAQTEKKGRFNFACIQQLGVAVECEMSGRMYVLGFELMVALAAEAGVDRPTIELEVSRG